MGSAGRVCLGAEHVTELRAGPLRMQLEGGDLRYVRLGQREVVRRLYVAVRDAHWNTVPPQIADLRVETGTQTFRVEFTCRHRQDTIDFVWQGIITGSADGTVAYTMRGQAESTFDRARIGICVLHPIDTCAGAPFRVTHPDGSEEEGVLPRLIAPHQPVVDMVELTHSVGSDGWVTLHFEGDVFEMEDQRNWTDASFKTYSTPLRLRIPVRVPRGTQITQAVTVHPSPAPGWIEPELSTATQLVVGQASGQRLPAIGLGLGPEPLSAEVVQRLRALKLAHVRVDLRLDGDGFGASLRRAAVEAQAIGVPLEVAVTLGEAPEQSLDAVRALVEELRIPVVRWLVFHTGEQSTRSTWVQLARDRLRHAAPFGGGSDSNFTELNRERPPVDRLDLVCYPIMPQAHAFDELSLVETLAGQAATVSSARAFVGDVPLVITPITLRRRPQQGVPVETWPAGDPRSPDDPRQASPFVGAWTLGSLATLAEAGVTSVTYFETTGRRGVMAADGTPFPAYHVFAAISAFAGARVVPVVTSDPLSVCGLGVRDGARERLLVANLTDQPRVVRVSGLRPRAEVSLLGNLPGEEGRAGAGGELDLPLAAYARAAIDSVS